MTDFEYNQLYEREVVKKFWEAYGVDYASNVNKLKNDSDKETQPLEPQKRPVKTGVEASAFRQDLSTEMMVYLRKKNYTYRQIADKLGCSPNTVRNRLKDKELLRSLWLDLDI